MRALLFRSIRSVVSAGHLLIATLAGCGQAVPTQPADGGGIAAALVGRWTLSAATGSQVCDERGHCGPAYGGSETYLFGADGRFEFSQLLQANLLGCTLTTFLDATGRATSSGETVTLATAVLRNRKADTCGTGFDLTYQDVDPATYGWRLGADDDGAPALFVTGADGHETGPYVRQ